MELFNKGYSRALAEIGTILEKLMADQKVVEAYKDYVTNVTDGDKGAAAVLVLVDTLNIQLAGEFHDNKDTYSFKGSMQKSDD